jgi:hypothetical protein
VGQPPQELSQAVARSDIEGQIELPVAIIRAMNDAGSGGLTLKMKGRYNQAVRLRMRAVSEPLREADTLRGTELDARSAAYAAGGHGLLRLATRLMAAVETQTVMKETKMNELQESIVEALKILLESDNDLIETKPKEECINHRFACCLERVLSEKGLLGQCNADIEYNKYMKGEKKNSDGRNIRPDILIHERRSGDKNNLIAIEAKKSYETPKDRSKIIDLVNNRKYGYSVGAVVSYFPGRDYARIKFFDGAWTRYWLNKHDFSIQEMRAR